MNKDFALFPWSVPQDGFTWHGRGPFLVPAGTRARIVHPLAHEGLFREFADLSPNAASVLKFANRWGRLTRDKREAVADWRPAIAEMRKATELWRAAFFGPNGSDLRKLLRESPASTLTAADHR